MEAPFQKYALPSVTIKEQASTEYNKDVDIPRENELSPLSSLRNSVPHSLDAADSWNRDRSYLISSMSRSSRLVLVLLRSSISAVIFRHWLCLSASVVLSFCFNSSPTFCAAKCASSALKRVGARKITMRSSFLHQKVKIHRYQLS